MNLRFPGRAKLYVRLAGGLGNQMFQYACARSLSLRHGAELVLDDWSGFVRDLQYRRRYELGALPIKARIATVSERWPIWLHQWHKPKGQPTRSGLTDTFYGRFIEETDFSAWSPQVKDIAVTRTTWITGYWQSARYFSEHALQIRTELMPPPVYQPNFVAMARLIKDSEAVALGIRVYEESKSPHSIASDGQLKTANQIRTAVARMRAARPKAQFFVFCTHHWSLMEKLNLPQDTVYLTGDSGFSSSLGSLWLLSQCRHHIFTNSSFYWWGAWLSAAVRGEEGQSIFAADNFYNRDGLCPKWETF